MTETVAILTTSTGPPPARRKLWRGLIALALVLASIGAGLHCLIEGVPLPVTAAERAAMLTAHDLEPFVKGLSAREGSESWSKRHRLIDFIGPRGVDLNYRFEQLDLRTAILCTVKTYATPEAAASPQAIGELFTPLMVLEALHGIKTSSRDGALKWGDDSWCRWTTPDIGGGSSYVYVFVTRKGSRVFAVIVMGPHLVEKDLEKALLPRLEALERF